MTKEHLSFLALIIGPTFLLFYHNYHMLSSQIMLY